MGTIPDSPLGKATAYPESYDAALLYPVERAPQRESLALDGSLPVPGADRWTAWDVTWLAPGGRPRAAIATFVVPCDSPRIVESKSVKLWLASLYDATFETPAQLRETLARDLSSATGAAVEVTVDLPGTWTRYHRIEPEGVDLDAESPSRVPGYPDPSLLRAERDAVSETLVTRTFRSVCPVTGQPDYACVRIACTGARIDRAGLFAYLVGYRRHAGFHEHCVERIYVDVMRRCRPAALAVDASFTRRGGIDINPFRASDRAARPPDRPTLRQ